jgi:hypothetical protein
MANPPTGQSGTVPTYTPAPAPPISPGELSGIPGAQLGAVAAGTAPGAIEQVVRAHESLARVAARIAPQIADCLGAGQRVLVQDAEGGALIAAFRAFRAQATLLQRAFDAIAPAPPTASDSTPGASGRLSLAFVPGAAAIATAIRAADALVLPVKHITGLMQSHVSGLEARLVRADETVLVAEVARRLRDGGRTVMYPRAVPLELRDPLPALELIAATLDGAQRAESAAAARVAALAAPDKTPAVGELAPLSTALARMRKQIFELPDASPVPSDARALIDGADRVRELDAGAVLLVVSIAGAGSTPRSATAWHWKPAYTAGAVVSYFVASAGAEVLRSGTVADYASFSEPGSF